MIGPIMLEQHIKCQLLEQTILIACQLSSIFVDLNSSINKQRIIWMDALTGPSYAFNWVQICFATALAENYFNLSLTSEYCCRWFRIISVAGFKLFLPWGLELCSYPHLVINHYQNYLYLFIQVWKTFLFQTVSLTGLDFAAGFNIICLNLFVVTGPDFQVELKIICVKLLDLCGIVILHALGSNLFLSLVCHVFKVCKNWMLLPANQCCLFQRLKIVGLQHNWTNDKQSQIHWFQTHAVIGLNSQMAAVEVAAL